MVTASILPEDPMVLTLGDAETMAAKAARQMIRDGAIGKPIAFRGVYDEDYSADPLLPWSWRMTHEGGGLGAHDDLGCHLVSHFVRHLTGPDQPDFAQGLEIEKIIHAMAASNGATIRIERQDK